MVFAICVEAGGFEGMAVRAARSIRKFGGRFASCQIVAVTPRFGSPLHRQTLTEFRSLQVDYTSVRPAVPYAWYPYMNKPVTVVEAMKRSDAELVCYVDSDMILMGEPNLLELNPDTDFAACASDRNIGVTTNEDETAPFWGEICRVLGIDFNELPWVHAHRDDVDIRMYFNAGMFAFRRSSGFADAYLQSVVDLLDAKVSSKVSNIYFHEQASLGLTAFKLKLRWLALPHIYNYAVGGKIMTRYEPQKVRDGIILHYHDMMWPNNWPALMKHLKTDRPEVYDWLEGLGPLQLNGSTIQKLTSKLLTARRKRKQNQHIAKCRVV